MNERIKKLASGCYVRSSGIEFKNFEYERFAELIVRECSEIADKAEPYKASDLIRKHFGVEE